MAKPLEKDTLGELMVHIEDSLDFVREPETREESMIRTKLQEAIMWTAEATVIAEEVDL